MFAPSPGKLKCTHRTVASQGSQMLTLLLQARWWWTSRRDETLNKRRGYIGCILHGWRQLVGQIDSNICSSVAGSSGDCGKRCRNIPSVTQLQSQACSIGNDDFSCHSFPGFWWLGHLLLTGDKDCLCESPVTEAGATSTSCDILFEAGGREISHMVSKRRLRQSSEQLYCFDWVEFRTG